MMGLAFLTNDMKLQKLKVYLFKLKEWSRFYLHFLYDFLENEIGFRYAIYAKYLELGENIEVALWGRYSIPHSQIPDNQIHGSHQRNHLSMASLILLLTELKKISLKKSKCSRQQSNQ